MDSQTRAKLEVAVDRYVDSLDLNDLAQIVYSATLEYFYRKAEQTEIDAFFETHLEGE